jgi:hypothetical protein
MARAAAPLGRRTFPEQIAEYSPIRSWLSAYRRRVPRDEWKAPAKRERQSLYAREMWPRWFVLDLPWIDIEAC